MQSRLYSLLDKVKQTHSNNEYKQLLSELIKSLKSNKYSSEEITEVIMSYGDVFHTKHNKFRVLEELINDFNIDSKKVYNLIDSHLSISGFRLNGIYRLMKFLSSTQIEELFAKYIRSEDRPEHYSISNFARFEGLTSEQIEELWRKNKDKGLKKELITHKNCPEKIIKRNLNNPTLFLSFMDTEEFKTNKSYWVKFRRMLNDLKWINKIDNVSAVVRSIDSNIFESNIDIGEFILRSEIYSLIGSKSHNVTRVLDKLLNYYDKHINAIPDDIQILLYTASKNPIFLSEELKTFILS